MKRVFACEEVCVTCTLCRVGCVVAHSQTKDIIKAYKKEIPRMQPRIRVEEKGALSFAFCCRHCEEPDCLFSCISGAINWDEQGRVQIDPKKCVACYSCVLTCTYGAIDMYKTSDKKYALKCDLCPDREVPACVEICPNGALLFAEEPSWKKTI